MTKFQFPPRSTRGAVLGFAWSQIALVMAGVIAAVVGLNLLVAEQRATGIATFVLCGLLVTLGLLRVKGRRITEWAPVVTAALLQRGTGQSEYRGGPYAPNGVDAYMDLPGPAAAYVWLRATAADGTSQVGLLHHRKERTVTAALPCSGANLVLADSDVQAQRLTDWAQLLNILGAEYADAGLIRWSVTSRAVPDTGNAAQRFLVNRAVDTHSSAYRSLAQLTAAAAPAAQRHEIYLSVVFDIARLSGEITDAGGTDAAIAAVVLERLAGIESAVVEAGITTGGWLSPRGYAAVIRTQFDPADQEAVDLRANTRPGDRPTAAGVEPRLAGPVAARTVGWNTYQHDSTFSRTLWVAQMPRQLVAATWLTPLYMRTTSRRTVTLVAQPVPAALAQLATRRDKVSRAGDEVTKRKLRLVRTAREEEEARSVEQIDREQAAGHVRYRYALLVTVTAPTVPELDRDVRAVKRILSRAGCEAIILAGEQDQAFLAGALPLARGLKPVRGVVRVSRRVLRREGSLADRITQRAAVRELASAQAALERQQLALDRQTKRLLGPVAAGWHGAYGRRTGRVFWQLQLPPLVTTSAQLCSVYPFVSDPGLPVDGPLIGTEVYSRSAFTFSLHELYRAKVITAPNMVVTGEIGSAKSSLLKCLAFRGIPFGTRFYGTDYKGEYEQLAAAAGITPVRIGPGLGVIMNPLAGIRRYPEQTEQQWLQLQRSRRLLLLEGLLEIQLGGRLQEAERSLLEYAVDAVTREHDAIAGRMAIPTLGAVLSATGNAELWQHRLSQLAYPLDTFIADSRRVRLALERLISGALGGVFDGSVESNARLDFTKPGAIVDLRAIRASDAMTAMAMTCAQSWLETELSAPDAPPRVCVYDEFALIARHLPLIRRMREQLKLARALGIANILAFHRFSDLAASGSADSEQVRIARGLIEDSGVRVSYRQATGSLEQAREFLGTSDVETDLLRYLRQGVGLWKIGTRSFVVKHQLSRVETAMVYTDSRMESDEPVDHVDGADYDARLEAASGGTAE